MVPTTLTDAWQMYVDGCGSDSPARTEADLRHLIYALDLSYWAEGAWVQPEGASPERWDTAWEAIYDTGWAWDASVPDEAVIRRYRALLSNQSQEE